MSAIGELQNVSPSEAFDNVAEIFDETFENEITGRLREKIYHVIESFAAPGSSLLDMSCGTGIDGLTLARRGYNVVGLDIAPKMIEIAKAKAIRERLSTARFQLGSFEHLTDTTTGSFDIVLSNFGGLNCVRRLEATARQVASVLKPVGCFVGTVMPPVCFWEIVAGFSRLNTRAAFRRLSKNIQATGFRGKTFTVYYHPLRRLLSEFSRWFRPVKIVGLSIFSPPPHAMTFLNNNAKLSRLLEQCDEALGWLPVLRAIGDHYMVVLRKDSN